MGSKSRASSLLSCILATASAAVLVVGCALDKRSGVQSFATHIGGHGGEILEPKRCMLKVAIISRSFEDPAINDVVWRVADEQIIPFKERHAWEINGLRIGRIIGELPLELDAILRETTAPKKIDPVSYFVDSGEQTLISVSEQTPLASLILNREERVYGKDYPAASGFFRVTVRHEGEQSVAVRLTPELHFGPIQRSYTAMPNVSPMAPQQFQITDGQQEETLRDLSANLVVEPGQVIVIGCRPEQKRGLGAFFLTQPQAHSDQRLQRLVLIWASRNLEGVADQGASGTSDRPRFGRKRDKNSRSGATNAKSDPGLTPVPPLPPAPGSLPPINPPASARTAASAPAPITTESAPAAGPTPRSTSSPQP